MLPRGRQKVDTFSTQFCPLPPLVGYISAKEEEASLAIKGNELELLSLRATKKPTLSFFVPRPLSRLRFLSSSSCSPPFSECPSRAATSARGGGKREAHFIGRDSHEKKGKRFCTAVEIRDFLKPIVVFGNGLEIKRVKPMLPVVFFLRRGLLCCRRSNSCLLGGLFCSREGRVRL